MSFSSPLCRMARYIMHKKSVGEYISQWLISRDLSHTAAELCSSIAREIIVIVVIITIVNLTGPKPCDRQPGTVWVLQTRTQHSYKETSSFISFHFPFIDPNFPETTCIAAAAKGLQDGALFII